MAWFINIWVILNILHYIVAVFALVKLAKSPLKTGDKIIWGVLIVLVPLIGSIVFLRYNIVLLRNTTGHTNIT